MEKTKTCRRGLKRLLALFSARFVCLLGVLPLSAFCHGTGADSKLLAGRSVCRL